MGFLNISQQHSGIFQSALSQGSGIILVMALEPGSPQISRGMFHDAREELSCAFFKYAKCTRLVFSSARVGNNKEVQHARHAKVFISGRTHHCCRQFCCIKKQKLAT